MMAPRRPKTAVDLGEARRQLVAVKTLVISLGMPMARIRNIDDALKVIDQLEERNTNV
jgi:hypothetical protein